MDLSTSGVWFFTISEIRRHAQQHPRGSHHLYMFSDPTFHPKTQKAMFLDSHFSRFLLENRLSRFF